MNTIATVVVYCAIWIADAPSPYFVGTYAEAKPVYEHMLGEMPYEITLECGPYEIKPATVGGAK